MKFSHPLARAANIYVAKTRDGKLRPAVGIFRGGPITTRPIVDNQIKDVNFFIEGRQGGMQSLDQHLLELHQAGLISGTETMRLANNHEAVAVGLRAARQASAAASTAGSFFSANARASFRVRVTGPFESCAETGAVKAISTTASAADIGRRLCWA